MVGTTLVLAQKPALVKIIGNFFVFVTSESYLGYL